MILLGWTNVFYRDNAVDFELEVQVKIRRLDDPEVKVIKGAQRVLLRSHIASGPWLRVIATSINIATMRTCKIMESISNRRQIVCDVPIITNIYHDCSFR